MSLRRLLLVALSLVLALAAFGCAGEDEPSSTSAEPKETEPSDKGGDSAEPAGLAYLTGTWNVTTELVEIDESAMTPAADQPGATWTCAVDGETMTLTTDQHEYIGTLTPIGENGWVYQAQATFTDEDGYTWISTILVNGSSEPGDLDTFSAAMSGSIDSDVEGHLYTARWIVEGTRQ